MRTQFSIWIQDREPARIWTPISKTKSGYANHWATLHWRYIEYLWSVELYFWEILQGHKIHKFCNVLAKHICQEFLYEIVLPDFLIKSPHLKWPMLTISEIYKNNKLRRWGATNWMIYDSESNEYKLGQRFQSVSKSDNFNFSFQLSSFWLKSTDFKFCFA